MRPWLTAPMRSELELRADIATLADRTDAQRAEVRAEQRADVAEIRADIAILADRIDASGTRVTQIELDQARQDAAAGHSAAPDYIPTSVTTDRDPHLRSSTVGAPR